jgi:hypothetical protein
MAKILIHMGPPKAGSTQIQRFFSHNRGGLREHSIDYLLCQPKSQIRAFYQERANRILSNSKAPKGLRPWFEDCPSSFFLSPTTDNDVIISEEALYRLAADRDDIAEFDAFLARAYSERQYLTVLREIIGHSISNTSQSIFGMWHFDYRTGLQILKKFSLDEQFAGMLVSEFDLRVRTFSDFVSGREATQNIAALLEDYFKVPQITLQSDDVRANASLGAEGTSVFLALSNTLRALAGGEKLRRVRVGARPLFRNFRAELAERLPKQQAFCPFTPSEQVKFGKKHRANSKVFMERYPGSWIEEVFSPVPREKKIVLMHELEEADRQAALDLLEHTLHKVMNKPVLREMAVSAADIRDVLAHFMKNEASLVL